MSRQGRYPIGRVAEMTRIHQQTIRHYERLGLIRPERSAGGTRYFSDADVERLRYITVLTGLGVNLAGVEMILTVRDREERLLKLMQSIVAELDGETRRRLSEKLGIVQRPGLVRTGHQRLAVFGPATIEDPGGRRKGGG